MTTKMIKIIEKVQSKHITGKNETRDETPHDQIHEEGDVSTVSTEEVYQVEAIIDPNNPYQGINLEQVSSYLIL